MTKIYIARHGNTFDKGDTVLRVGLKTDLPLSTSGRLQAEQMGVYLRQQNLVMDAAFCSTLCRTAETAQIALAHNNSELAIEPLAIFNEIDYGVDEGQTEDKVVRRVGQPALDAWDRSAVVPPGWQIDPNKVIADWLQFADEMSQTHPQGNIFVMTSNGIARFAPHLTHDYDRFCQQHTIKLSTGALSCFVHTQAGWMVDFWNLKPARQ